MVDSRGRYESEGEWRAYVDEAQDGYDTQQWIGAQAWCDGNIGMFGISYPGFTQILPGPVSVSLREGADAHCEPGGQLRASAL